MITAFVNGVVLIIGSIFILRAAIPRLFNPVQPDADGMIILAIPLQILPKAPTLVILLFFGMNLHQSGYWRFMKMVRLFTVPKI